MPTIRHIELANSVEVIIEVSSTLTNLFFIIFICMWVLNVYAIRVVNAPSAVFQLFVSHFVTARAGSVNANTRGILNEDLLH
jgi:hypothetical protein